MKFKLVASDLDGTLLSSAGEVSQRSRAALAGVQEAGGVVVLITGRPSRMVLPLAKELGLSGHVICSNGAATHRLPDGEAEDLQILSPEVLRRAVPALRSACPDLGLALEWGSGMQAEAAYRDTPGSVSDVLDVLEESHPVLKVMARSATFSPAQLAELVNALCGDELHASLSGAPFAEIAALGVHKSAALARLCAGLGIQAREVRAQRPAATLLGRLRGGGGQCRAGSPGAGRSSDPQQR